VPQDIPIEASEEFAFTPASLAKLDNPPVFVLRTPTHREKRHLARLNNEEGVRFHATEEVRAEALIGIAALFPEKAELLGEAVKDLWTRRDDFESQQEADPELIWDFDGEIEARLQAVVNEVFAGWAPLRRMVADNRDFSTTSAVTMVSVMVKSVKGITVEVERDRGYLSIETANALRDALWKLEEEHKLDQGAAWQELGAMASMSLYLGEEEAKNLLSPVPSETSQALSNEMNASETAGKSPASKATDQTADSLETQSTE
jgi:hypothetical protein